jgi:hypothetical protein
MSRWSFVISQGNRAMLRKWLDKAPPGFRLEISEPKRSSEANALMWVLLTEISRQVKWHGLTLSPEDWKDLLSAGLKREIRTVPNIDGNGFVALGMRTSTMTKAEMADFISLIEAFGAREGVTFEREAA